MLHTSATQMTQQGQQKWRFSAVYSAIIGSRSLVRIQHGSPYFLLVYGTQWAELTLRRRRAAWGYPTSRYGRPVPGQPARHH